MRLAAIAPIAALTLAGFAAPALAQSSAEEIRSALVGNTFQGDMGSSEYTSYFGEDGTYADPSTTGAYTITDEGVCYPGTDYGCYQATIDGDQLEWSQDGKPQGSGRILEGNPLGFGETENAG
ncbi:hypothetical protein DYI37_14475 [Fulvimarina endophytica]|uniref:DUF995 domain-containing protein n=1 Tax=Fulvimarina endophytica TaxID=2293836 RepID=A0A371X1Q0_9HYPH|nr:hypothetical protein [Fulvimarina endophytica]RFC63129.1 hypothetical protein DYI37_14475 [Fulvimarina endophytica]